MRAFAEATPDHPRLLETVAQSLARVLGDTCSLRVTSEDGEWLEPVAIEARDPAVARQIREYPNAALRLDAQPMMQDLLRRGEALLIEHLDPAAVRDGTDQTSIALMEDLGMHSVLVVPLRLHGAAIGLLNLTRLGSSPAFDEYDRDLAMNIAEQAALAIGHARMLRSYRRDESQREESGREIAQLRQVLREDLSERRRAESRFACLADAGILGVLIADWSGRVSEVNDALLTMIGRSRGEVLAPGFSWGTLTPTEWRAGDDLARDQLRCMGVAGLREKELVRPDGRRVPVMVGTAMLEGGGQEAISFILDLTERKHAEREAAALREARVADALRIRLAAIVDSTDDAIIGESLDGLIETWNPGAERMFGYAAAEVIGLPVAILDPAVVGPKDAPSCAEHPSRTTRFGHFDARRRRKDGELIDVAVTRSAMRDPSGAAVGACKVVRDITDRKRAEEALALAKEATERANRELEAFSYSVAHDLRAPLRGMSGFAAVLLEDYGDKLDAEGRDCLEEIQSNAVKMGALIDALLSLSRVARSELRPSPVDLSALARTVAAGFAAAEPDRAVELIVAEGLTAAVDAALARALLENLLGNAWKFTGRTARPRVEFGSTTEGGARVFYVRDNGAGFDMAHAQKLFAAFQRLHAAREFPGTGIGLATVQRIIHRHGGRVWADGRINAGATFYFTIPVRAMEGMS